MTDFIGFFERSRLNRTHLREQQTRSWNQSFLGAVRPTDDDGVPSAVAGTMVGDQQISDLRTKLLDQAQGIAGYFFGGGWAFGRVENANFVYTADSLDRYQNLQAGPDGTASLRIEYRVGNPDGNRQVDANGNLVTYRLGQDELPDAIGADEYYILQIEMTFGGEGNHPLYSELSVIDQAAVVHDKELRELNETYGFTKGARVAKGGNAELDYNQAFESANARLIGRIDSVDWNQAYAQVDAMRGIWTAQQVRDAYAQIAYYEWVARFARLGLSTVDGGEKVNPQDLVDPATGFADAVGPDLGGPEGQISDETLLAILDTDAGQKLLRVIAEERGVLVEELSRDIDSLRERDFFDRFNEVLADRAKSVRIAEAGAYGRSVGTIIGNSLPIDNPFARIGATAVISTITENFAEAVVAGGFSIDYQFSSDTSVLADVPFELADNIVGAGVGAVSSYLVAEVFDSLGIDGVAAELGSSFAGSYLATIASNIAAIARGATDVIVFNGLDKIDPRKIVGAYYGSKLADDLVSFDTVNGQIGAEVGSAVVGLIGGSVAGPPGAFIGAFVGRIYGGFIGSLFGAPPKAWAEAEWEGKQFSVTHIRSKHGGSRDAVRSLVEVISETLNGAISITGAELIGEPDFLSFTVGMRKERFYYEAYEQTTQDDNKTWYDDAGLLIADATYDALVRSVGHLGGGDIYAKRALATNLQNTALAAGATASSTIDAWQQNAGGVYRYTDVLELPEFAFRYGLRQPIGSVSIRRDDESRTGFDLNALYGDMSIAQDYANYLADPSTINALIAAEPNSAFAAGWAITFVRATELGLHKRARTDWVGGWNLFLDETLDGQIDGSTFVPTNLVFTIDQDTNERRFIFIDQAGDPIGVLGDTIDTAGKTVVGGTVGNDVISITRREEVLTDPDTGSVNGYRLVDEVANTSGLTIDGVAPDGSAVEVPVAAVIRAGDGADTVYSGDLGNDVFGGTGNDLLVGGALDDWLFGEAGNDRLFAGRADGFDYVNTLVNNADREAHVLSAAAGNGDLLDGGAGNDALYGGIGSDWLRGGDGVDTLLGGAGGDIIDGGAGSYERLEGGAGSDQYIFGFGSGDDTILDGSGHSNGVQRLREHTNAIALGLEARGWAGDGTYTENGDVVGGSDAVVLGPGVTINNLRLQRVNDTGSIANNGWNLRLQLGARDAGGDFIAGTDSLTIENWFHDDNRVEWLRFANGEELRIGNMASFVTGTPFDDQIIGTTGNDYIVGAAGDDSIYALAGEDFAFGEQDDDFITGDNDDDYIAGGSGNDRLLGGTGNDIVSGDGGDDQLQGGADDDILSGGLGDDTVVGGLGDDVFLYTRGDGRDTLFDAYSNNWELVWRDDGDGTTVLDYQTGFTPQPDGTVTRDRDGAVIFDGNLWVGVIDLRLADREILVHAGEVAGVLAGNAGTDLLEFTPGIDIQDLVLVRSGDDLVLGISDVNATLTEFQFNDSITLTDWFSVGAHIESFAFAATGVHQVGGAGAEWTIDAGTDGSDTLVGDASQADWIGGAAGDDVLQGRGGDDILDGDGGDDILDGGAGVDVLYGGAGDDTLIGGSGADVFFGGAGNNDAASYETSVSGVIADLANTSSNVGDAVGDQYNGIESLHGSNHVDTLRGDEGSNELSGGGGNDILTGRNGDDTYVFEASGGHDVIRDRTALADSVLQADGSLNTQAYQASWTLLDRDAANPDAPYAYQLVLTHTPSGIEVYRSLPGDFVFTASQASPPAPTAWDNREGRWLGGTDDIELPFGVKLSDLTITRNGQDLVIAYGSSSITIEDQQDPISAVEELILAWDSGGEALSRTLNLGNLSLVGEAATSGADLFFGGASQDVFQGVAGNDTLYGAVGDDTLEGGEGDDLLIGAAGADHIDGGEGNDTLSYESSVQGVTVDLSLNSANGGDASGDVVIAVDGVSTIENLIGSDGADTFTGDNRNNTLEGRGGNDTLHGQQGDDALSGGAGSDMLRGDSGDDILDGGLGNDTLRGAGGSDLLDGGAGNDIINAGHQDDTAFGGLGHDSIQGGSGDDMLSGGDGNDTIKGGSDHDQLFGDEGDDTLYGEDGQDVLYGGLGNDHILGGDGNDTLVGGGSHGSDYNSGDDLGGQGGDDSYIFGASDGFAVLRDNTGSNTIQLTDLNPDQIWLRREGQHLHISAIDSSTDIRVVEFWDRRDYWQSIDLVSSDSGLSHTLFLRHVDELVSAMAAAQPSGVPAVMPQTISESFDTYWHAGGVARSVVADQSLTTDEDIALQGAVSAIDHDADITEYRTSIAPVLGTLNLVQDGTWTYTPDANLHGTDGFAIEVLDAAGHLVTQHVTVDVKSVNDAPHAIIVSDKVVSIAERDYVAPGTDKPAIKLATLTGQDVDAPDGEGLFDKLGYSVSDSRFEIRNVDELWLKSGASLDYEAGPTATVAITVTDHFGNEDTGLSYTKDVTFNVTDVVDVIEGSAGADSLVTVDPGSEPLFGNVRLHPMSGDVRLEGAQGDDLLWSGVGNDYLRGGIGDDTLRGGAGNDALVGHEGDDAISGEAGNDHLKGGSGNDHLDAGLGDDVIWGATGNDVLLGGAGDDRLYGEGDDDILEGGEGADRFYFGDGSDTLTYENASSGVSLSLKSGSGTQGDALGDIFHERPEVLIGSAHNDVLEGSDFADHIKGGDGNDTIRGLAGSDRLYGGAGDDVIEAGSEGDKVDGGLGDDTLVGGTGDDVYIINSQSGVDLIRNYDQASAVDVIGYQGIDRSQLWFSSPSGTDDLVVDVIGTGTSTIIENWFQIDGPARENHRIDFFLTEQDVLNGNPSEVYVDVADLVDLMASYQVPTTQAQMDALIAPGGFADQWAQAWGENSAPVLSTGLTVPQTVNEDGTLTIDFHADDDYTPQAGLSFDLQVSMAGIVVPFDAARDISTADANGNRTLTINLQPDASGTLDLTLRVMDAGGRLASETFQLNVVPVADAPHVSPALAPPLPPVNPDDEVVTRPTLDSSNGYGGGRVPLNLNITKADSSETISRILITDLPAGLSLNNGTLLSNGDWELAQADAVGLEIMGPEDTASAFTLSVEVTSQESNGAEATTTSLLPVDFNARPTSLFVQSGPMEVEEETAETDAPETGRYLGTIRGVDPDGLADFDKMVLVDDAGGRFKIVQDRERPGFQEGDWHLQVKNGANIDYEQDSYHTVRVQATDAGGLTVDEPFRIDITNVNERPFDPTLREEDQFMDKVVDNEDTSNRPIARFRRQDPDGGTPMLQFRRAWYAPWVTEDQIFEVIGDTLHFKSGYQYDYETSNQQDFSFELRTVDNFGPDGMASGIVNFSLPTVDANDKAAFTESAYTYTVGNNAEGLNLVTIADLSSLLTDADQNEDFRDYTFWITDAGDTRFVTPIQEFNHITSSNEIRMQNGTDYERRRRYVFDVHANDSGQYVGKRRVTINVDPPTDRDNHVGDDWDNTLFASNGNDRLIGYKGNDTLHGGNGNDGYVFNRGDGYDTINDISGADVLYFNDGVRWTDLFINFGVPGTEHLRNHLDISLRNSSDKVRVLNGISQHHGFQQVDIEHISVGGTGTVGIGRLNHNRNGTNGNDTVQGHHSNRRDLLAGHDGNDYIYANRSVNGGSATGWEENENLLIGGNGNDVLYGASGDDVYVYEYGNGIDWIIEKGGVDRIHFGMIEGRRIERKDIKFKTVGDHLVIGVQKNAQNSGIDVSDMPNRILIVGGVAAIVIDENGNRTGNAGGRIEKFSLSNAMYDIAGQDGVVFQPTVLPGPPWWSHLTPVVFDLNQNNTPDLVGIEASNVGLRGHGAESRVGWFGPDDGLLVLDRNQDGVIDRLSEISFVDDYEGATTDMEGLRGFDSNGDNAFNAADARWSEFQVWQDLDQNGVSSEGELHSLAHWNIESVSLDLTPTGRLAEQHADNFTINTAVTTLTDGSAMVTYDTMFAINGSFDLSQDNIFAEIGTASHLGTDSYYGASASGEVRGLEGVEFALGLEVDASLIRNIRSGGVLDTFFSGTGNGELPTHDVIAPHLAMTLGTAGVLNPASNGPAADPDAPRAKETTPLVEIRTQQPNIDASEILAGHRNGTDLLSPDEELQSSTSRAGSAADRSLALVAKQKIQMVEALASFGAGEQGGLDPQFGQQAHTSSLLTSLPDVRAAVT